MNTTKIANMIVPEVMANMISGKVKEKIVVSPFAKIDDTLAGQPGDEISVPSYEYIGDAMDVAEGEESAITKLTTTVKKAKIKKAMKAVELTDEAVLSGYGNPVAETNNQLALAIAAKVDADALGALYDAQLKYNGTASNIGYSGIVDAIDVFEEEINTPKVMFVHPKQVSKLRKDNDFISVEKYPGHVIMTGEIGMIANTRIVPTKRVKLNPSMDASYRLLSSEPEDWLENYSSYYTHNENDGYSKVTGETAPEFEESTYYVMTMSAIAAGRAYMNPIVKLEGENDTEDETPALTIYLKRDTNVETERHSLKRSTDISVDKFYTVALSNSSKVVLAYFKK